MKIRLWGVRGSIPTTGPDTEKYGGNTSCATVAFDENLLVLDGGTGIRPVSSITSPYKRIDILLTHLHLDHIQGLGFFSPLFDPSKEIHIWGPASGSQSLFSRISRYLSPPLFPVLLRDVPCKLELHEVSDSIFDIGPFKIRSSFIIHPGPTVGYRIMRDNFVFTYMPDHEPAFGQHGMAHDPKWVSGYYLAEGADLLLHDSQYTKEEYVIRRGWGHSSIFDAGLFVSITSAKHTLFAHHDPSHSDTFLEEMLASFKSSSDVSVDLAREGFEAELK